MLKSPAWLVAAAALLLGAAFPDAIAPFSASPSGAELPAGWLLLSVPGVRPPEVALVHDGAATVLRLRAEQAAGSVAHRLAADPSRTPVLSWRWKVDRVIEKADLARKDGDDYAARVYVSFDFPEERLAFTERARMKIAKLMYGTELPTAALCYVWDNRHPVGASAWNAYTSRVRMIVLSSGAHGAGSWVTQSRDVAADYVAAFGAGPVPAITGVAVAADTDQTRETVTAWFGDLRLEARP